MTGVTLVRVRDRNHLDLDGKRSLKNKVKSARNKGLGSAAASVAEAVIGAGLARAFPAAFVRLAGKVSDSIQARLLDMVGKVHSDS